MRAENELLITTLDNVDNQENLYINEYSELKGTLQRSILELEKKKITSYITDLKEIQSKENLTYEDYNRIFRLRRRISKTEEFKNQYLDWFVENLELGVAIHQAGIILSDEYNPIVTYGVSMPKGMYVNFEDIFLRIIKKSDFYNDYAYSIKSKDSAYRATVLFKDVIDTIKKCIEESNGDLNFNFKYNGYDINYPLIQKEKCIMNGEDVSFCTLIVNEDVSDSLFNAINESLEIISNIHTINVHNEDLSPVYDNVVDFTLKKD